MIIGIAHGMAAVVHGMGAILMEAMVDIPMAAIPMTGVMAAIPMEATAATPTAVIRKPVMPILLQQLMPRHPLNRQLQHQHILRIQHTMDIDQ